MSVFIKAVVVCDGLVRTYGGGVRDACKYGPMYPPGGDQRTPAKCDVVLSVGEQNSTVSYDSDGSPNRINHVSLEVAEAPQGWRVRLDGCDSVCPACIRDEQAANAKAVAEYQQQEKEHRARKAARKAEREAAKLAAKK